MLGMTVLGTMNTRRLLVFAFALIATGLAIVFTGYTNSVGGAAAWTLVTGLGTGVAYVCGFTELHATVEDELRGRTFAAMFAFARVALLFSFALAGVGAAALDGVLVGELNEGIRAVIVLGGTVVLLVGGAVLWAARHELRAHFNSEQLSTMADASNAITWMRGDRQQVDSERRRSPSSPE
jgi:hypothetical protein